jgi:hypothetical protein
VELSLAIGVWREKGYAAQVEYSDEAIEQLRLLAIDGLLSLPRVGIGIGGLLLGTREGGRIKILDSIAIPCSHAMGPSFLLTAQEIAAARQIVRTTGPLSVLGGYCSKTRGFAPLTAADLELFGVFCPEPWQMMLQIKPSTVEESRAVLCFRDKSGTVVRGAERTLKIGAASEIEALPEIEAAPVIEAKIELKAHESQTLTPLFAQFSQTRMTGTRIAAMSFSAAVLVMGAVALLLQIRSW